MFVYWGRNNGGKLHMRYLSKMNSQTLVITEDQMIIKEKYTVKNRGVSPDGRLWIDSIIDGKIYYRLDQLIWLPAAGNYNNYDFKTLHRRVSLATHITSHGSRRLFHDLRMQR